jgi:2-polyprenyl-6-methoxyphenol hydroxylase-like FAD-dependent oxidoreductase
MLALSQASTEKILTEALHKLGKEVERGTKLTTCKQQDGKIEAFIEKDGQTESVEPSWLLATDGSHSTVREQLGLDFPGTTFPETWYLADVTLSNDFKQNSGHVWLPDEGGFFVVLPVIEDIRKPRQDTIWRLISNSSNLYNHPEVKVSGKPIWESNFRISHRIVPKMQRENIYFAGDAAHIHSPIGARGMNLGIEDSWSFAELLKNNQLDRYNALRLKIDQRVVKRVEFMTKVARAESLTIKFLRRNIVPFIQHLPFISQQMMKTGSGLDHPLELN